MKNSTNNSTITEAKASNNQQRVKDLIDSTGKAGKALSDSARAITESANAVTRISEHMVDRQDQFLAMNKSRSREFKYRVLEDAYEQGNIKAEDALRRSSEMQKEDTEETVRLMNTYSESNKTQGSKGLKIGVGVGAGALGTGILIWILNSIFGNDKTA